MSALKPAAELAAAASKPYPGDSADYRRARTALLTEEIELRRHIERVAAQRRAMHQLNRVVTGSALVLAWACGLWLAWRAGWFASGWLHVKLVIVLVLSGLHGAVSAALRRAGADAPRVPARAWRVVPALALAGVVGVIWLALMKPF